MPEIWEIARNTFKVGSVGSVLWSLMFLGVGGFLLADITAKVGKGQISRLISIATSVGAIVLVSGVIINAITIIAKICGFG